jgi:transposase InsO family protein
MDKFEIKHLLSTPYHLQTNGLVERFNKTLCESIAKVTKNLQEWDSAINSVLFAYRTARNSTTKFTPFYLTYGREAKLPITALENETLEINMENLEENGLHVIEYVTMA